MMRFAPALFALAAVLVTTGCNDFCFGNPAVDLPLGLYCPQMGPVCPAMLPESAGGSALDIAPAAISSDLNACSVPYREWPLVLRSDADLQALLDDKPAHCAEVDPEEEPLRNAIPDDWFAEDGLVVVFTVERAGDIALPIDVHEVSVVDGVLHVVAVRGCNPDRPQVASLSHAPGVLLVPGASQIEGVELSVFEADERAVSLSNDLPGVEVLEPWGAP